MAEDVVVLNADGTYSGRYIDLDTGDIFMETHGIWYVTKNNPFWNLYWNDPKYELYQFSSDGTPNVNGLALNQEEFGLTNDEGGGYVRTEDAQ